MQRQRLDVQNGRVVWLTEWSKGTIIELIEGRVSSQFDDDDAMKNQARGMVGGPLHDLESPCAETLRTASKAQTDSLFEVPEASSPR